MKNVFLKYVILIFGIISFSGCYSSKKIQLESNNTYVIPNLISTSDTIYLLIEEIGLKSPIPLIVSDTFNINMGNEGKEYKLIFKEEKDSILLEYKGRNSEKAVINKGDISLLV
ncbi:MAG: hypothetical protein KJN66_08570, partial [Bacteroidia bacterium]|nr:hypothetical protein [Bacteroidia bacterium]